MFFDTTDTDEQLKNETTEELPIEYEINFDTGQLTGKKVSGSEAVKVWAWMALQTMRYMYPIYSWNYGSQINDLIGQKYSDEYTRSLIQKMLEDCLFVNKNIIAVKNLACSYADNKLTAGFTLVTKYGEEELNV